MGYKETKDRLIFLGVLVLGVIMLILGMLTGVRIALQDVRNEADAIGEVHLESPMFLRVVADTPPEDVFSDEEAAKKAYRVNFQIIKERNRKICDIMTHKILRAVRSSSEEFDISEEVLLGLMDIESSFRISALSSCSAFSLMQINWPVWRETLRKEGIANQRAELAVPNISLRAGAYILRHYLDEGKRRNKEDILAYAITRYNGGYKNPHYERLKTVLQKHNAIRIREGA